MSVAVGAVAALVRAELGDGSSTADVEALVRDRWPLLSSADVARLTSEVVADVCGLGVLEPLLADDDVTDILINGPGPVWVERRGELERAGVTIDDADDIVRFVERIVAPLGLRLDRSSPFVDARLPDGSRLHAVVPPLAVDGPCVAIRRFGAVAVPLAVIAAPPLDAALASAVARRQTIVVSGGTGAGKTTLLNALAAHAGRGERIVTIEDAAELRLPQPHVVRLEARPGNADGAGEVTIRQLVRNALRLRPDRIVVGEVRGAEAFDMLQALNTGHRGSLTTCHANGAVDALSRLETMVLMAGVGVPLEAVRRQLLSTIDLVVHVERAGRLRRVTKVLDVAAEVRR